jgi:phosphomannomutase
MKRTIRKVRASFGSEISGHYYFREIKNADSAILATIKVLNALARLPYTSAQFSDLLPDFYYQQFNQKTKKPAALVAKTAKIYSKKAKKISRLDGFLFDFGEWFLIVRPSNTESLVRFFVGSQSKKTSRRELARLKNLLP